MFRFIVEFVRIDSRKQQILFLFEVEETFNQIRFRQNHRIKKKWNLKVLDPIQRSISSIFLKNACDSDVAKSC